MSQYILADEAIEDLKEISDYFFTHNIEAGERFIQAFNRKCQQLVKFPNLGRSYSAIVPNLRGILLDGYIIFYKVSEDRIEILRVVSGRRNLDELFSESDDE